MGVGGTMYRPGPAEDIQETHRTIQKLAKIPLLLAANTEAGGNGLAIEGAALGLNWSFAPIVDIDQEFHNPITNTRTFGSDQERVIEYASRYMDAADEHDVAVAIKHFPGAAVEAVRPNHRKKD